MILKETYHIPSLSTTKAFEYPFGRGNMERRCFFTVKRTVGNIPCPSFFKTYKLSDDFGNIGTIQNFLYGRRCNHTAKVNNCVIVLEINALFCAGALFLCFVWTEAF